ncbi:RCBTB1 [Cordylochernes scorpioides]|uniref:RCBTB1 n=1 Tax=Cordylochernes scorpioides TaxID=51811 RepID=A0ABY6L9L5_9ARAC|nr:RCBTB1 [Cordylochernes scorpioides]
MKEFVDRNNPPEYSRLAVKTVVEGLVLVAAEVTQLCPDRCMAGSIEKWLVFSILDPVFVANIKLACVFGSSGNEAIIVTKDDEVFALGSNSSGCLGLGDAHGSLEPRKVEVLCKRGIVKLAYGSGPHVLAATEEGELYSWGHNGYCQLGNGSTNQGLAPGLLSSSPISRKVAELAAGSHHSMVLTRDGEVYGWGYNGNGQLGLGNNINQSSPFRVANLQGVVIQKLLVRGNGCSPLYANKGDLSVVDMCVWWQVVCGYAHTMVLSDEGVVYTWGANSYGQLGTGNKANQVTPIRISSEIGRCHSQCCHSMVDISQFPYPVYYAFLKYLYTDDVDVPPEDAIGEILQFLITLVCAGLLDLANSYCETQLKQHCERIIKHSITVENAAMLYAAAINYEARELEEFCFQFSLNHLTSIVQTEAFNKLDEPTIKNFILKAAQNGAFKY